MRNSRAVIVGSILVVVAGLVAWKYWQPESIAGATTPASEQSIAGISPEDNGPRSPVASDKPGKSVSQASTAASGAAPPDAGARLDLRSIRACHDALLNKKVLESEGGCDKIPAEQATNLMICRNQQAQAAKELNDAQASAGSCPPDLLNASAYYEAIKDLALRGDIPAQRCFIQGYFASASQEGEESRMRKEQVDEYLGLARKFIDEAFERGDWSVVRWLGRTRTGLQDGMLNTAYPFGFESPENFYRMNYLLTLGNQPGLEPNEGRRLMEVTKRDRRLTPEQIQEAESWARNMYDQHFNGSQEGLGIKQFCEH